MFAVVPVSGGLQCVATASRTFMRSFSGGVVTLSLLPNLFADWQSQPICPNPCCPLVCLCLQCGGSDLGVRAAKPLLGLMGKSVMFLKQRGPMTYLILLCAPTPTPPPFCPALSPFLLHSCSVAGVIWVFVLPSPCWALWASL